MSQALQITFDILIDPGEKRDLVRFENSSIKVLKNLLCVCFFEIIELIQRPRSIFPIKELRLSISLSSLGLSNIKVSGRIFNYLIIIR